MENRFHGLPPLKRYRLMQRDEATKPNLQNKTPSSCLPAKKRKENRDPSPIFPQTTETYSLPAKKRIWAPPPPLSPINPNLEYTPSLPAKKRIWAPPPPLSPINPNHEYTPSLPAKKRIWAPPPLSQIDLNLEFNPFFDEEEATQSKDVPKPLSNNIQQSETATQSKDVLKPLVKNIQQLETATQSKDVLKPLANKIQQLETIVEEEGDSFEYNPLFDKYNPFFNKKEATQSKDVPKLPTNNIQQLDTIVEEAECSEDEIDDDGIVCAVCQSTDGDPSDPIVFCDGCDLKVHTTCYGHPLTEGVPEGDWFCSQCLISKSFHKKCLSCCLCPVPGGALKPTIDGRWAHIVCALFVPEVFFTDPEGREGIDCTKVPPRRWEQSCYVCDSAEGCVIDCSEPKCQLAFHITCGFQEDLSIEYKEERKKGAIVAGFCKRHTDLWKKQQASGKYKIVAREEDKK